MLDRVISITDSTFSTSTPQLEYTYDSMINVLTEANAQLGTTVTYTYDANGRRTSMQLSGTSPPPPLVTYSYDCADELMAVSNNGYTAPSCSPTTFVQPSCSTSNSTTTCLSYDGDGRRNELVTNRTATYYYCDVNSRISLQSFFDYHFRYPGDFQGNISYQ
jgi:YD repeat-containing protein